MRRWEPISGFQGQVDFVQWRVLDVLVAMLEVLSEYEAAAEKEPWIQSSF